MSAARGSLRRYLTTLVAFARVRLLISLSLLGLAGLTEGFGLLLLVPFVELVTTGAGAAGSSGVGELVATAFARLGVPLSLGSILLVYVALVTLRALLGWLRDLMQAQIRYGFVAYLQGRLYAAIGAAEWSFLSRQRASDLTQVLVSDLHRVGFGTSHAQRLAVDAFMILVALVVALRLSVGITLAALASAALLVAALWPALRRARGLGTRLTEENQRVFATVSEFLGGLKLAKSYRAEPSHTRLFDRAVQRWRERTTSYERNRASTLTAFEVGAALLLSILVWLAAQSGLGHAELLVLALVLARMLPLVRNAQGYTQNVLHMLPAFEAALDLEARCRAAAELPVPTGAEPPALDRAVQLTGVCFRYEAERPVLDGVELELPARHTTALVGRSGSGKTTIADLLIGLLPPDAGEVRVDGEPLLGERRLAWRNAVAYVPQEVFLFDDSVRANLLWARPDASEAELWEALRHAAAEDFVRALPAGLDSPLGAHGSRLSGGERQRLALARALLRRPRLLILDEATSSLDPGTEQRIQGALDELHGELTILLIAHRLSTVRSADRIAVLEAGRVVEVGSWEELAACRGGALRALIDADALER